MAEYASLRKIEFELCGGNLPEKYKAFVRRVLNDRNLIPAADVAPVVHGRWIHDGCRIKGVIVASVGNQTTFARAQTIAPSAGPRWTEVTAMRLIDADALLDCLGDDPPMNWTDSEAEIQQQSDWERFKHMVDNMPTIEPDAIVDDFSRKCPVKGHHDWRMVAIEHDEVGDRINTYRCSKCGEEFNVKFVT